MKKINLSLTSFDKRFLHYAQELCGLDFAIQYFGSRIKRIGKFDAEQFFEESNELGERNSIALAVDEYISAVDRCEEFDQIVLCVPLGEMNVISLNRRGWLE